MPLSTLAPFIGSTTYNDFHKKFDSEKKVNYKSLFTDKKELKIDIPFYGKTAY